MANSNSNGGSNRRMEEMHIDHVENGDFMVNRIIETDQPENLPALLQMPATPIPAIPKKITIGSANNMVMFVGTKVVCHNPPQQGIPPGNTFSSQSAQQQSGQPQPHHFDNQWRQPPSHYGQPEADMRAQPSQPDQFHAQSDSDVQPPSIEEPHGRRGDAQGARRAWLDRS